MHQCNWDTSQLAHIRGVTNPNGVLVYCTIEKLCYNVVMRE